MHPLAERFLAEFSDLAMNRGWVAHILEEDDYAAYERTLDEGFNARIGLDLTPREWGLVLNPAVSVRAVQLAETAAHFLRRARGVPVLGANLSDLLRASGQGDDTFAVESMDECRVQAVRLMDVLDSQGEAFFGKFRSLEDVITELRVRANAYQDFAHLSIACALVGDWSGVAWAIGQLEGLKSRQSPLLVQRIDDYLKAFRTHFGVE